jgi:hypothetical protein
MSPPPSDPLRLQVLPQQRHTWHHSRATCSLGGGAPERWHAFSPQFEGSATTFLPRKDTVKVTVLTCCLFFLLSSAICLSASRGLFFSFIVSLSRLCSRLDLAWEMARLCLIDTKLWSRGLACFPRVLEPTRPCRRGHHCSQW